MTTIPIPPEAEEAAADVIQKYRVSGWTDKMVARAAAEALLKAWPGRSLNKGYEVTEVCGDHIILPLPPETEA